MKGVLRFIRVVRTERPDVVHSHVATFSAVVLMLARALRVRGRIAHFRSDADKHGSAWVHRAKRSVMRKLLLSVATDVVAVSPGSMAFATQGVDSVGPRFAVLPSGLDTSDLWKALEKHPQLSPTNEVVQLRILHVGRTSEAKNRPRAVSILRTMIDSGSAAVALAGRAHIRGRGIASFDRLSGRTNTSVWWFSARGPMYQN